MCVSIQIEIEPCGLQQLNEAVLPYFFLSDHTHIHILPVLQQT